ncbi:MAG: hypothetical protein DCC49_06920 [Acidobacteria bacterium]|nr:MAG: hypothetical protein DCC49_06920 [Acidobacteriota bacterium]
MRNIRRFVLLAVMATLLTSCSNGQSTFTATEAAEETGSSVTVCDVVADVRPDPISSGPLYLDLVRPAPDQAMTIMIQNRDGAGAIRYLGHEVCASGLVEATGGDSARPRLMVKSPSQVRISGPAPAVISAAEAAAGPERIATVCDVVAAFRPDSISELTGFLDLVRPAPDALITVVLEDRRQLVEAASYPGKTACVTGYVKKDRTLTLRDPRELVLK